MKFESNQLLDDLSKLTNANIIAAEEFSKLNEEQLNYRAKEDSWSILECLEHLNLYGDFYIPEIEKAINKSDSKAVEIFKSGWLGNKFANDMKPKEKLNKMGTFKDKNPLGSKLDTKVIDKFLDQQKKHVISIKKSKGS